MSSTEPFHWALFTALLVGMLALDLLVFQRRVRAVSLKEAVSWSLFWLLLALLFNAYVFYFRGHVDGINFLTGYLIEKSLSLDNLFIFLLIFDYFQTPPGSVRKVLFFGVIGAIVMRAIFIVIGIALVTYFHWILYVFGAFLIFTGIQFGLGKSKKIHPKKNPVVGGFRRLFPVARHYEGNQFFVFKRSRYFATPLCIVLLSIETADLLFAVDSVPAVLAITRDPFIVYTSNIFAILGLRSLYFVLLHAKSIFYYMHYAVSFILVFVGIKMVFSDLFFISNIVSLIVIFSILLGSITVSLLFPRKQPKEPR